jgi:hypothetical protein
MRTDRSGEHGLPVESTQRAVRVSGFWETAATVSFLLLDAFHLADEQHLGNDAEHGDHGHVDEGRGEAGLGDQQSDGDRGASAETSGHVIDARPLPKNTMDVNVITKAVLSVKFAPIMAVERSSPAMIGDLRATSRLLPRLTIQSESTPLTSTPIRAAMSGSDARNGT